MVAIDFIGLAEAAGALAHPAARIQTASIGIPDTFFLMLLALVVFGPRRLPEIGRQIGKLMYEFRKVSNDFKFQMEEELRASEEAERLRKLQAAVSAPAPAPAEISAPAEPAPLELASSTASETGLESAPAVEGEVRAESPKIPQILPPSTGDPIAAQKPFRSRYAGPAPESAEIPGSAADQAGAPTPATGNSEFSARVKIEKAASEVPAVAATEQEVQHG